MITDLEHQTDLPTSVTVVCERPFGEFILDQAAMASLIEVASRSGREVRIVAHDIATAGHWRRAAACFTPRPAIEIMSDPRADNEEDEWHCDPPLSSISSISRVCRGNAVEVVNELEKMMLDMVSTGSKDSNSQNHRIARPEINQIVFRICSPTREDVHGSEASTMGSWGCVCF